jgi:hypothetical protein
MDQAKLAPDHTNLYDHSLHTSFATNQIFLRIKLLLKQKIEEFNEIFIIIFLCIIGVIEVNQWLPEILVCIFTLMN